MAHGTSAEIEVDPEDIPTIRELRASLGLTSGVLARLLGVKVRNVRRWLDGTFDVPETVLRLLWIADRIPQAREMLEQIASSTNSDREECTDDGARVDRATANDANEWLGSDDDG